MRLGQPGHVSAAERDSRITHQSSPGPTNLSSVRQPARPGSPSLAQHRDPVGCRQRIVQLVGDQDNRGAGVGKLPGHLEQQLCFRRSEHPVGSSSRSILASPPSALTNSSRCLSDTDSRPARWSGSSGSPMRSLRTLVRSRISRGAAGHPAERAMFSATVRAGTEVKCWWTIPMPRARATRGVVIRCRSHRRPGLTGVRAHQPIRDMHQGGLPGAVFPQKGMHFARGQHEIDPAQRMHGAESLLDAAQARAPVSHQRPVGWSWKSHSSSNCSAR